MDDDFARGIPIDPPPWSGRGRAAMERAVNAGVPSEALSVFARWWQLESWLRTLVYLELRAAHGRKWIQEVRGSRRLTSERDAENAYMPSPDSTNLLSYLTAGQLLDVLQSERTWPIVEYALLKKSRWDGKIDEIKSIRNRIAHLRRPHSDDLPRLEQLLRDLEPGTRQALEAFNSQAIYPNLVSDALADAWVRKRHIDAQRLVTHAIRQYKTEFQLSYSVRPWVARLASTPITGRPGVLIHASWQMFDGALLRPADFWRDNSLDYHHVRELIVLVVHDHSSTVSVSFSGVDEPKALADAIGTCFDIVLRHRQRHPSARLVDRWLIDAQNLDWRVQAGTAIILATPDQPFHVFDA